MKRKKENKYGSNKGKQAKNTKRKRENYKIFSEIMKEMEGRKLREEQQRSGERKENTTRKKGKEENGQTFKQLRETII
jgi:hypothetical protein